MHLTAFFPVEFMHLIWENLVQNLVDLWTGAFKDLGTEAREISQADWKGIGDKTSQCGRMIPSQFGPSLPNIADARHEYTADSWCFWKLYVAPVVLRHRFRREHVMRILWELVRLLRICLQFEITLDEIREIREGFAEWVEKYDGMYRAFCMAYVLCLYNSLFCCQAVLLL